MPFTPYHFGPSGLVGLVFRRWIDVPVFVLANVAIDFEPGIVLTFRLNYPVHGYAHTLLFGGLAGLVWGLVAFGLKDVFKPVMRLLRLWYEPSLRTMLLSGLLGVWFHILLDSLVWSDVRPLWPSNLNPLFGLMKLQTLEYICLFCFVAAFILYGVILLAGRVRASR